MNRRTFAASLIASAASLASGSGFTSSLSRARVRNVVLVHGAYADGSSWREVIVRLQRAGFNATAVQHPLTTLDAGVEVTRRALALQDGPTVLVGHSYGGMIITQAGVDPAVSALVYVAARAPDAGEDYTALASRFPTPPASAGLVWHDGYGKLDREAFLRDFAGDVPHDEAMVLYAVRVRSRSSYSPPEQHRLRGARNRAGTPFRGTTAPSTPTSSASWRGAWEQRRSRWIRATFPWFHIPMRSPV